MSEEDMMIYKRRTSKIGDKEKYWITSLIPPKNKNLKLTFDIKISLEPP